MSLRQLCQETRKCASQALFLFPEEHKTGIMSTRKIVEKDLNLMEGQSVHVLWEGKQVLAKILCLHGKYQLCILKSAFFYLSFSFLGASVITFILHTMFIDDEDFLVEKHKDWLEENFPSTEKIVESQESTEAPRKKASQKKVII